MPATELLYQLLGINTHQLTLPEKIIIQSQLLIRVYEGLKQHFRSQLKDYFVLIKLSEEMENTMLEANLLRYVINDILASEEYSLPGIACYTQTPEEVIFNIIIGQNKEPSLTISRKIIELHQSVRPHLYRELMKKILAEHLGVEPASIR